MKLFKQFVLFGIGIVFLTYLFVGCRPDESLQEISQEGGHWEWVYSIDEANIIDTVARASTYGHTFRVERAARKSDETQVSMRYYMDDHLMAVHHVNRGEMATIYEGAPFEAAVFTYHCSDGSAIKHYVPQNVTDGFKGFYMYEIPIDKNGLRKVKNYFQFVK